MVITISGKHRFLRGSNLTMTWQCGSQGKSGNCVDAIFWGRFGLFTLDCTENDRWPCIQSGGAGLTDRAAAARAWRPCYQPFMQCTARIWTVHFTTHYIMEVKAYVRNKRYFELTTGSRDKVPSSKMNLGVGSETHSCSWSCFYSVLALNSANMEEGIGSWIRQTLWFLTYCSIPTVIAMGS